MYEKNLISTFIYCSILALLCTVNAQNTESMDRSSYNTFGFKGALNYTIKNGSYVTPTVGFSYEWVPKWSGIETGAYYTNYVSDYEGIHALTHHIQIPIFWKIHTKYVNIALGLQTLCYVGYTINESKSDPNFEAVKEANFYNYGSYIARTPLVFDAGAALRIGFPINLSKSWSLEPQLGMEYMYDQSFSATIGFVFRVNK